MKEISSKPVEMINDRFPLGSPQRNPQLKSYQSQSRSDEALRPACPDGSNVSFHK